MATGGTAPAAAAAAMQVASQRDTDFVRKAPRRLVAGLFVMSVGLFGSWGFYTYAPGTVPNAPDGWIALCLPLAKMFGRVLTLTLCLVLVTSMRTLAKTLRTLPYLRFMLPLDALMPDFHRALAFTAFAAAVGHAGFHTIDYVTLGGTAYLPWTGGFCVTFAGERTSICLVATGGLAVLLFTAIVIIALVYMARLRTGRASAVVPPATTLPGPVTAATPLVPSGDGPAADQRVSFATVQLLFTVVAHWILVPTLLVVVALHAQSKGTSYVAIPIWILAVAAAWDVRQRYRATAVRVIQQTAADDSAKGLPPLCTTVHGNVVQLVVERPPGFVFKAGQSALLQVDFGAVRLAGRAPWLYGWQYHPFTIACSPADAERTGHLVFLIRNQNNVGSWTRALHEAAMQLREVRLAGPSGAPYEYYDGFETVLLVGSGAGVTPLTAIFTSMVSDEIGGPSSSDRAGSEGHSRSRSRTVVSRRATINGDPSASLIDGPRGPFSAVVNDAETDDESDGSDDAAERSNTSSSDRGDSEEGHHDAPDADAIIPDAVDGTAADPRRSFVGDPSALGRGRHASMGVEKLERADNVEGDVDAHAESGCPETAARGAASAGATRCGASSIGTLAAALLAPRMLVLVGALMLAMVLAIGVYQIVAMPTLAYDWVMVLLELILTGLVLSPLFAVRLYVLLAYTRPAWLECRHPHFGGRRRRRKPCVHVPVASAVRAGRNHGAAPAGALGGVHLLPRPVRRRPSERPQDCVPAPIGAVPRVRGPTSAGGRASRPSTEHGRPGPDRSDRARPVCCDLLQQSRLRAPPAEQQPQRVRRPVSQDQSRDRQ